MMSKVYSAAVVGVKAFEVEIEVHAGWGNTDKIAVVGLPDTAVKESKDRVTSAISNSAFRWPYGKRKPQWWRVSMSMEPVRFPKSCISCEAMSSWSRSALPTAGPPPDPSNRI
jgi:Mg-chelatase subunit ChlI-like protein